MLTCDYKVLSIDGDYAHLEGCILHYEMMQYEMKN